MLPRHPAQPQSRRRPRPQRTSASAPRNARPALPDAAGAQQLPWPGGATGPGTYRLVGAPFAQAVPPCSAHDLLAGAAQGGLRLAIAVDAGGASRRYVGELRDARIDGDFLCARGEGFELRLAESAIAQAWIVRRPSRTGLTQTLELFDAAGAPLASFASDAGPCGPERCDWRLLIHTLAAQADPCAS